MREEKQQLGPKQLAWIEALESGQYQQTKSVLFDGIGYCCLGVACKVAGLEPVKDPLGDGGVKDWFRFEDKIRTLPLGVVAEFGLHSCGAHSETGGPSLWTLNDVQKMNFHQIAAQLRANPAAYFKESK